ncbi:MAG TPA: FUSC family protein [Rhizomicrobium sp.]|nr:FUSC family protein [Rhizomicrobium sp.]
MKTRLLPLAHWARALFSKHQDALLVGGRVGLSATLAYLVATLQHVPETYWPVMSAVIVARGGAKGAGGSATDRLVGTLAGAGVGLAASFLHRFGMPDWALLFAAMAPMAFLSADNTAFRAAPMAAMIVLSATASGKPGLYGLGVAGLRVLDVGMGTLVALFVSYVVLPSNALKGLRKDAAALMMPLAKLLALGVKPGEAEARDKLTRLNARTRREMREVVVAARQIKPKRGERHLAETLPNQFTAALGRTHGSIVFINRAVSGAPLPENVAGALRPFVRDARARLGAIHHLLADGVPLDPGAALDASVEAASARIAMRTANDPAAHLEALPFLLQTLRDDLNDLAATAAAIAGPPKMRSREDVAAPVAAET